MAAIDDLLRQIPDEGLRRRVAQEFETQGKQKKFGLVWEDHVPECTPLPDVRIKRGSLVARRGGEIGHVFRVVALSGGVATCLDEADGTEQQMAASELMAVARFGEPVFPYLQPQDSICRAPESDLWHTLIEADNFHALQLLAYLYAGQVDCIYIDPPYNTGARDWKYNNDYVDSADQYRHSKWLSMMEKRLRLAKRLLNPQDSVLIVTIDEKEYLHLGCLLEEMFPEANIQMVSSVINPTGTQRPDAFNRTNEFIYFLRFGNMKIAPIFSKAVEVDWRTFRRQGSDNLRPTRPNQFYPIYVNNATRKIDKVGDAIPSYVNRFSVEQIDGCTAVFPIKDDGTEMMWSTEPLETIRRLKKGYIRVGRFQPNKPQQYILQYLYSGKIADIESGKAIITGKNEDGSIRAFYVNGKEIMPTTQWKMPLHNAQTQGSKILKSIIGESRFDFPKSLYAVHDTLRFFVANKPNALIVDFFAGSGTTLHAVNLLNKEDGGRRRCIMVTNNEVSEDEARTLTQQGHKPGDEQWERLGIARYVTWPRTTCSVLGTDVNGKPINGDYLTYKTQEKRTARTIKQLTMTIPDGTAGSKVKKQIVGLLGKAKLAQSLVTADCPYIVSEDYPVSILFDDSKAPEWLDELDGQDQVREVYVVTQNNRLFNQLKTEVQNLLGDYVEQEPLTIPMQDGFEANVEFFKLGFLDKNAIAMGRQFREILPLLWLKAGAKGKRPELEGDDVPPMLLLPENGLAVLADEAWFDDFAQEVNKVKEQVDAVFIVTDSEPAFLEMSNQLQGIKAYQLYRDYLDNFRINLNQQ